MNVVDEHITETGIVGPVPPALCASLRFDTTPGEAPPFNITSAFIVASRVFHRGMKESIFNDGCNCGFGRTPEERLLRLTELLHELRYILDGLPTHMRQWGPGDGYQSAEERLYSSTASHHDPFAETHIAHTQNEIARANVHVSHLWLQNFLLDKMDFVLQEMDSSMAQTPTGGGTSWSHLRLNWREREDICRQLLHILHSIPHAYLEPNGLFLVRDLGYLVFEPALVDPCSVARFTKSATLPAPS